MSSRTRSIKRPNNPAAYPQIVILKIFQEVVIKGGDLSSQNLFYFLLKYVFHLVRPEPYTQPQGDSPFHFIARTNECLLAIRRIIVLRPEVASYHLSAKFSRITVKNFSYLRELLLNFYFTENKNEYA